MNKNIDKNFIKINKNEIEKNKQANIIDLGIGESIKHNNILAKLKSFKDFLFIDDNYSSSKYEFKLIKKIIEFQNNNFITLKNDNILLTTGITEGIFLALSSLSNPLDEVLILKPNYPLYDNICNILNLKITLIDDFTKLSNNITPKFIIINSPNNPTGKTIKNSDFVKLIDYATKNKIYLIIDNCYNELIFKKEKTIKFEFNDYLVFCYSFSKIFHISGSRCGYILSSKKNISFFKLLHKNINIKPSNFSQIYAYNLISIYLTKYFSIIKKDLKLYKKNSLYVYNELIKNNIEVIKPEGTFYLFFSIKKTKMTSREFCKKLLIEHKINLMPGIVFNDDNFVRITVAKKHHVIKKAIKSIIYFINVNCS